MADIRTQSLKEPVDVGDYLFTRLHQVGVRSVHGLPGDYNLVACDYVPKCGLTWVGNANELNAAYAADGYARVNGISAIMTTFGVGELSAMNGIAGAFSEHVPVVHIVGCPSTASQRNGKLLHHTLGNDDFNVFSNMFAQVSCAVAKLYHPSEIAAQIDHALQQCWVRSRPVYIMLPSDMVVQKIEGERLKTPIDLAYPINNQAKEDYVVDVVLGYLHKAKNPIMLVDACAIRHNALDETHELADKLQIPVFVAPMGKSGIDETKPYFGGVYAGAASEPAVKDRVESSDLILSIGGLKSDFNTGGFTYHTSQLNTIDFHSTSTIVRYSEYPGVGMKGVLRQLIAKVDLSKISVVPGPAVTNEVAANRDATDVITQAFFWPRVGDYFKKDDVIITETGTSNFGIWATKFPSGVTALNQTLWGSIGWSVGAAQGAALAVKDAGKPRRSILFVGDGSFELTAQEVSTMVRHGLPLTIFLLNNEGYTIERWIHGMDAEYNDIQNWKYTELPTVFGATEKTSKKFQVKTKAELEALLTDPEFIESKVLQFVEVFMPKQDAPLALKLSAAAAAKMNDANN